MAESFALARSHLIYGVCLPLAVLVGYFLASPLDSDSLAVVFMVLSLLSVPILMRWHHPLLIFSWNAPIVFSFLPGLSLVTVMVLVSLFFSLLNRSLGQKLVFLGVPSVAKSLIFLSCVVLGTAFLTGGIGLRALGSSSFGGRKYFTLLVGVLAYFALAVQRVPRPKARWYSGMFFLSGAVILAGWLASLGGSAFDFVRAFMPLEGNSEQFGAAPGLEGVTRLPSLNYLAGALYYYLLMRHGVRGVLDLHRPWRGLVLLLAVVGSLFGGFRSVIILYFATFVCLFYWEGLFRTRLPFILLLGGILGGGALLPLVGKLPLSAQRTLSFLPINVDPIAREDAEASTAWRLNMWQDVLPQVPRYLIKGKGYTMNPDEMFMVWQASLRQGKTSDLAMYTGDYHSGPLSVILPFGILGLAAFVWFLAASIGTLLQNLRHGDPELKSINTFLLAYFVARTFFFVLVFGDLSSDLLIFTGLVGLSVSLNGGVHRPAPALAGDFRCEPRPILPALR